MKKSIETVCVHGGEHAFSDAARSLTVPVYQSAAFSHLQTGHNEHGFDYTRISNAETVSSRCWRVGLEMRV